jgi:hypothetical protein
MDSACDVAHGTTAARSPAVSSKHTWLVGIETFRVGTGCGGGDRIQK